MPTFGSSLDPVERHQWLHAAELIHAASRAFAGSPTAEALTRRPSTFTLELIDGKRLARFMLLYSVGVQPQSSVTLYEVDEDYFEGH
ncbi:unannotated protein [freshwater metagenome]|uniref:Unannotated protein n=1 Tax=freshwater metagenome TaxID=449393 RepID=A0A6J6SMJ5_9ZZZZ|nr:hypothetical protein [Actinomycetota bacterium]